MTLAHEVLIQHGADFSVEKRALSVGGVEVPGIYGLVRTDNNQPIPRVAVGERFGVLQHHEALGIIERLLPGSNGIKATLSEGGGRLDVTFDIPVSPVEVRLGDVVRFRGHLVNVHGRVAVSAGASAVRLWCTNQLRHLGLVEAYERAGHDAQRDITAHVLDRGVLKPIEFADVRLYHRADIQEQAAQVEGLVESWHDQAGSIAGLWKRLAETPLRIDQFVGVANDFLPAIPARPVERTEKETLDVLVAKWEARKAARERKVEQLTGLFVEGKGNEGKTLWDGYNGITEYLDHKRARYQGSAQAAARLVASNFDGEAARSKGRALALLERAVR